MAQSYEGSHLEFAAGESSQLEESNWDRWFASAEKALGFDLDGDEAEDGYSIDGASDRFDWGWSVSEYVEHVREQVAARDPLAAHLDRVLRDARFDANGSPLPEAR